MAEVGDLDPDAYQAVYEAVEHRRRAREWRHVEELLALLLEAVGALHRTTAAAAGAKTHELPKPVRYPRPHEPRRRKPPPATRAEIRARFGRGRP